MLKYTGQVTPVPLGLVNAGPLIDVQLSYHRAATPANPVPPVAAKMMVDTGAQRTVVEQRIAAQLGLAPVRFQQMIGVSQKPEMCPVYLMSITFGVGGGGHLVALTFSAEVIGMSSPPTPQLHAGLLGRDFLKDMRLNYDGPAGRFELIPDHAVVASALPPLQGPNKPSDKSKDKAKRKKARKDRARNRHR